MSIRTNEHLRTSPAPQQVRGRLLSLDVVKGVMLVVSVGVNSIWNVPRWFEHAPWAGVHPVDLVFPVFVTLSGCGLAFAMRRAVVLRPLLRRAVVLLAAGLLYNAVTSDAWDPATWRVTGVLQLYAAIVLLMALGHVLTRTWRGWAMLTMAAAAVHCAVVVAWARTCPGGVLTPACNPSGLIDTSIFGAAHTYAQGALGHDPEGIFAISGAFVSAAAGAVIGHLLLDGRALAGGGRRARAVGAGTRTAASLVLLAVALVGAAWVSVQAPSWFGQSATPVMKRLWTAPFALAVAAGVALSIMVASSVLDRPSASALLRSGATPLIALGRNSLLVYFGSHVVMAELERTDGAADVPNRAQQAASSLALFGHPQVTWTVLVVVCWCVLVSVLHARRIYLRP